MIKIVEQLKFRGISGETCWDLHINPSQYYHMSSLVWFKWVQRSFPHHGQKQTHKLQNFILFGPAFPTKARTISWGCTSEPTHSKIKSRLISATKLLFQELPMAFLGQTERESRILPAIQRCSSQDVRTSQLLSIRVKEILFRRLCSSSAPVRQWRLVCSRPALQACG